MIDTLSLFGNFQVAIELQMSKCTNVCDVRQLEIAQIVLFFSPDVIFWLLCFNDIVCILSSTNTV